jgi:hypothetical protein
MSGLKVPLPQDAKHLGTWPDGAHREEVAVRNTNGVEVQLDEIVNVRARGRAESDSPAACAPIAHTECHHPGLSQCNRTIRFLRTVLLARSFSSTG